MKIVNERKGRVWYVRVPEDSLKERFPLDLKYDVHLRIDDKNTVCRIYHNMLL
jgi:hypothetical protein